MFVLKAATEGRAYSDRCSQVYCGGGEVKLYGDLKKCRTWLKI